MRSPFSELNRCSNILVLNLVLSLVLRGLSLFWLRLVRVPGLNLVLGLGLVLFVVCRYL